MNLFGWELTRRRDRLAIVADAAQAREHGRAMAVHAARCEARTAVAEAALALLRGDHYERAGRGAPVLDSLRVILADERWRSAVGRREEVDCHVDYEATSEEMHRLTEAGRCDFEGLEWVITSVSHPSDRFGGPRSSFTISIAMVAVAARRTP